MITANEISRLIVLAERVRFDQRKFSPAAFASMLADLRVARRYALRGNAFGAWARVQSAYISMFA